MENNMQKFPRTTVGGISMPRMIIGTNWLAGYSHTSDAADRQIRERHSTSDAVADVLIPFMQNGIDAIMGGVGPVIHEAIQKAEQATGGKMIRIETPSINVDDNPQARKEAEEAIKECKRNGATFCFPHHQVAEQLVNKNKGTMDRLPDYLYMIRDHGMIPGLSAHMPELILYSDSNGYDVETYIQIYNCLGFLMQVEIEYIHKVIWNAKKPVMTIKPMAAGRCTPFVGLNFVWNTIRECDMVTVGCYQPYEVYEDIEISLAALQRRMPEIKGRNSSSKSAIVNNK